jgi:methionine salvage enolase-phosphatase E1
MKTILVDAVNAFIDIEGNIFKDMQILLDSYPNKKIILTGADYEDGNSYNLKDAPYEVFTLKHDPEKTDPAYYEAMLKHFALDAKDVIYFEHNAEAVKSAQSIGILTFHYDKDKKDLDALRKFIDENL